MKTINTYNINNKLSNEYLLLYLFFVIVTTFSKLTVYSQYLHPIYEVTIIISILLSLMFLFLFSDNDKYKSSINYLIIVFTLLVILIKIIFNIQIVTFPLLAIYLFIANLKYVNLTRFIKNDFRIRVFILVTILSLYILHLTPYQTLSYRSNLFRFSGGFSNYNGLAEFSLCLIFSYILLLNENIYKIKNIIILIIMFLIVFILTDSRGFATSSIIILVLLSLNKFRFVKRLTMHMSIFFLLICAIFAIYTPIHTFNNEILFNYFNKMFSNRLVLQHLTVQNYPIKFIGYPNMNIFDSLKVFNDYQTIYIDNNYLMLLLTCGIIGFCIFMIILIRACSISLRFDNYVLCVVLISLFSYMIVEISFFNINCYVPIIYSFMLNRNGRFYNC